MDEIRLGTKSSFKTMPKTLHDPTAVTTQDRSGNAITMNNPVAIYARVGQCFYAMILYINKMLDQGRPFMPGSFTEKLLKEYRKLY